MDSKDMLFEALCDALHHIRKAEMRIRRVKDWDEEGRHDAANYLDSIMSCVDNIVDNLSTFP